MFAIRCGLLNLFAEMTCGELVSLLNRNERIARGFICDLTRQRISDELVRSVFRTESAVKLEQTAIVRSFVSLHRETVSSNVTMLKACRRVTEFKGYLDV